MTNPGEEHSFRRRHGLTLILVAVIVLAAFLYVAQVPAHPPGFYIDESSIAYNAYLISQTGRDEYGETWPLYFRAFGDYKNPTFIYLLAALFRATGPSITAARLLSATFGFLAGGLFGLLGWRMSNRLAIGLIVAISAWLTPWLFESSRLVFEVALYPALLVLFLLALWRATTRDDWKYHEILALSLTLTLLTYSYSIGRLFAPLLAAGLALFITRRRLKGVVKTWLVYAVTLVPLLIFSLRHPGALSGRFNLLTYIAPNSSYPYIALEFARHFAANINPWRWVMTGENNIRDHVGGHGSMLLVTAFLGLLGFILVFCNYRAQPWWRFIVYASIVSLLPASLTSNEFPQLRLIAFPVFFHVFLVPALGWLLEKSRTRIAQRLAIATIIILLVSQGIFFQWLFHKNAPKLWYVFDDRFPRKVLAVALATQKKPIYLVDSFGKSGYIQALWYATLRGVDTRNFIRIVDGSVPAGALVISTNEDCSNCTLIARSINYIVYAKAPSDVSMSVAALAPGAFRARISAENLPAVLKVGSSTELNTQVTNVSVGTWPAVGESDGRYGVALHYRWLKPDGTIMSEGNDSSRFHYDLEPGDTDGLTLKVTAPQIPGQYILELDVVQEQVGGFGSRGSESLRAEVKVEK